MTEAEVDAFHDALSRPAAEVIEALPLPDLSAFDAKRARWRAEAMERHDREMLSPEDARRLRRLRGERLVLQLRLEAIERELEGLL